MQKPLFIKLGLIVGLIMLLMIPIGMVDDVVSDRMSYMYQAKQDIRQSWTGSQQIVGPLLVMPYKQKWQEKVWDEDKDTYRLVNRQRHGKLVLLPEDLNINGQLQTEERQRGLYKVPVYTSDLAFKGNFSTKKAVDLIGAQESHVQIEWTKPFVSLLISDLRGMMSQPKIQWDGEEIHFESGASLKTAKSGMHVPVDELTLEAVSNIDFSFQMKLRGMETIKFSPIAKDTKIQLDSPWQHPSFFGHYLPTTREISEQGFQAEWFTSSFSSGMNERADSCAAGNCDGLYQDSFGVSLVKPIDIYQQSDRSLKYAVLFLALTFAFFFLYEVMKQLSIHPVQYTLVGLALSLFYLLLVSLSEHLSFGLAYLIAAIACSGLLGTYIGSILKSRNSGVVFFGAIGVLYGVLYGILQSEDNALLMGSMLLFIVLAAAMLATRHIDWYQLNMNKMKSAEIKTED